MDILYRLTQNWDGIPNGSCISEERYRSVFYLDKPLFEIIQEFEIKDMIEYVDEAYCIRNGIEKLLFYTQFELQLFLDHQMEINDRD